MPKKRGLYYVKLDTEFGKIILDRSNAEDTEHEVLIKGYRLTKRQGKLLNDRLVNNYKRALYPDVIMECRRLFYKCKNCDRVVTKDGARASWRGLCRTCYDESRKEAREVYNKTRKDKDKLNTQLTLFARHMKTLQGHMDTVPLEVIMTNIRLRAYTRGVLHKDIAAATGRDYNSFWRMMNHNEYMKEEDLIKIAKVLNVRPEELLRTPRGYRIDTYHGYPARWFTGRPPYMDRSARDEDE